jgi:signal transduction histidine kinase
VYKEMGLGLANSRGTARLYGGDLKVKQDTKQKKITFKLILPIYKDKGK